MKEKLGTSRSENMVIKLNGHIITWLFLIMVIAILVKRDLESSAVNNAILLGVCGTKATSIWEALLSILPSI